MTEGGECIAAAHLRPSPNVRMITSHLTDLRNERKDASRARRRPGHIRRRERATNRPMKIVDNPPNPFESAHRELLEPAPHAATQVFEEHTGAILTRNDSPDLPFRWSVNPYRGCFHACAYCYARPSHQYWGFGAGTDFESKLIVKPNAAGALRAAFLKPSWRGELVVFSGNTDCYQPLEAAHEITRACLAVCADFRNPVAIVTKAPLIQRDMDLLRTLNAEAFVRVWFSVPFADDAVARKVEPQTPSVGKRLEAMAALSAAGIPTGVLIGPVIPGLNEQDVPRILHLARQAGATYAAHTLLRLNDNVRPVFLSRMADAFPDRIGKIVNRLKEIRGGELEEKRFFARHRGRGPAWRTIEQLFEIAFRKEGFRRFDQDDPVPNTFTRPAPAQGRLFS